MNDVLYQRVLKVVLLHRSPAAGFQLLHVQETLAHVAGGLLEHGVLAKEKPEEAHRQYVCVEIKLDQRARVQRPRADDGGWSSGECR
jgi:hypothetical protein